MANVEDIMRQRDKAEAALKAIWDIVHTPTKDTEHKKAQDHFQSDFDKIRTLIKPFADYFGDWS